VAEEHFFLPSNYRRIRGKKSRWRTSMRDRSRKIPTTGDIERRCWSWIHHHISAHTPADKGGRGLSPRPAVAGTEEGQRSQPRCRSGPPTGHRTQNPAAQGPSWALRSALITHPITAAPPWLDPGGERWPIFSASGPSLRSRSWSRSPRAVGGAHVREKCML
jgi:hypothetical protein